MHSSCSQKVNVDCHKVINVCNRSDVDIYVYGSREYPDTNIYYGMSALVNNAYTYKTKSNTINESAFLQKDCWEYDFNSDKIIKSDTLIIFIIESSELEVNLNYNILQRYDLSLEDLQNSNWTLYYPPTETMKKIKMYPPYGQ